MLVAAERYAPSRPPRHGRLIQALRPYGDDSISIGDAPRAAAELGSRRWRFVALAGAVVEAAESRGIVAE